MVGLYIFAGLFWAIVWGIATNTVVKNKGYDENWFWWGFLFGFIAFIIALSKSEKRQESYNTNAVSCNETLEYLRGGNSLTKSSENAVWVCKRCRSTNQDYIGTCSCGMTKEENSRRLSTPAKIQNNPVAKAGMSETERAEALKMYKELLDSGVINEEEFAKKKTELLS